MRIAFGTLSELQQAAAAAAKIDQTLFMEVIKTNHPALATIIVIILCI